MEAVVCMDWTPLNQVWSQHNPTEKRWQNWLNCNLRQYAAIKLKVPNSGIDWLDVMIVESLRDDIAAKALVHPPLIDTSNSAYAIPDTNSSASGP